MYVLLWVLEMQIKTKSEEGGGREEGRTGRMQTWG